MSSTPLIPDKPSRRENRRLHPRRKLERLAYADLGPDNGGVLIELGQGGLSFQGVGPVGEAQLIHLKFTLPSMSTRIEATGQVVWSNNSGKGGGLRFVDLDEEAQQQIKEWISSETPFSGSEKPVTIRPGAPLAPENSSRIQSKLLSLKDIAETQSFAVPPNGGARQSQQEVSLAPEAGSAVAHVSTSATLPVRTTWNQTSGSRWYSPAPLPDSSLAPSTAAAAGAVKGSNDPVAPNVEEALAQIQSLLSRQLEQQDEPGLKLEVKWRDIKIAIYSVAACLLVLALLMATHIIDFQSDQAASSQPIIVGGNVSHSQVDMSESQVSPRNIPSEIVRGTSSGQSEQHDPTPVPRPSASPVRGRLVSEVTPPVALQPSLPIQSEVTGAIPEANPPRALEAPVSKPAGAPDMVNLRKPLQPGPASALRVNSFQKAELIQRVEPVYPLLAKQQNLSGAVQVSATIGRDGKPHGLKRVSGDPTLAQAAQYAISGWLYKPAVLNGEPVEVRTVITINFQIMP
jgi:protein TonB